MNAKWNDPIASGDFFKSGEGHRLLLKLPFILFGLLVGLIAVGFAKASEEATELFYKALEHSSYWTLLLTPLGFMLSRYLVHRFAPTASGSGIPQVMASLELATQNESSTQTFIQRLLSFRVIAVKIGSNLVCLVGGGISGREGPMVQIAASLFLSLGHWMKRWFPKLDATTLIASGGAAGIAAAFNTPLGGIVFAIEELIGEHFTRVRSSMIITVIIAGMVAQSLIGSYLMFGSPHLETASWNLILPTILLAAFLGGLGGLTGKIFIEGQTWIAERSPKIKIAIAGLLGFLVALLILIMPLHYGAGGGIPLIRDLLWKNLNIPWWMGFTKWLGMMFSFLSGVAGGYFAPSLAVGALMGKFAQLLFPHVDASTLILVGMVSYLSSVARAPFTSLVLVSEMSNGHTVIMPLMLGSLIGLGVARFVEKRSYYEYQAHFWIKAFGLQTRTEI